MTWLLCSTTTAMLAMLTLSRPAPTQESRPDDVVAREVERFSAAATAGRTRDFAEFLARPTLAVAALRVLLADDSVARETEWALRDCLIRMGPSGAELVPDLERRIARVPADRAVRLEEALVMLGPAGVEALARRYSATASEPDRTWSRLQAHATRTPDAMIFVLRGLAHANESVRNRARGLADSLRAHPPRFAQQVWCRLVGDAEAAVRGEALHALAASGVLAVDMVAAFANAVEGVPLAELTDAVRVLARSGDAGVAAARRCAESTDRRRRAAAWIALVESDALEPAELWERARDADQEVRAAVIAALARRGATVLPACRERLERDDECELALQVLVRMDRDPGADVAALRRLVASPDPRIATLAKHLLGRHGGPK